MSKPKTLNDKAWEKLFDKYNILDRIEKDGIMEITSKEINEFREARLMTKFDHKSNLPILFEKNSLSILPITRGSYIIARFEAYHDFEDINSEITKVNTPAFIDSIDFENITSEATAISVAYLSGILGDFLGEEKLNPTVNGRMSSETFEFDIFDKKFLQNQSIRVVNSQIEIDGGYESFNSLALIEAKNSISKDFLVRQIYYPFRLFDNKIRKLIKPVFLTYTNGIFNLYEYKFEDPFNYNSLVLVRQKNYSLNHENITFDEVISILDNVKIVDEPIGIPFPQADSFERVVNLSELLNENEFLTRDEITYNYDFDTRQTNYYTDAGRYLGLIDKEYDSVEGVKYFLTDKGKYLFSLNLKNRNLFFAKYILEKKAFNETFKRYIINKEIPQKKEIVEIMRGANLYNVASDTTFKRRASTISGWIRWVIELSKKL